MRKIRIVVSLGIFMAAFALAPVAQASTTVQIALTAITQLPTTTGGLNELEHTTQKLKITNQDILLLLGMHYPDAYMTGTVLARNGGGQFELRNANDVLLDTIALEHLQLTNLSTPVSHLLSNTGIGVDTHKKIWAQYSFRMSNLAADEFALQGMQTGNTTNDGVDISWRLQYQLAGQGLWYGRNALITGRIVSIGRDIPISE